MKWANLLHFYQPYGQKREIVDKIVAQCYRPVAEGILASPTARISVNFTGVLLDLLDEFGHREVIEMYKEAALQGRVELVGSAKYHAILPLLPPAEAFRQVEINNETNRKFFGDLYTGRGIFLPEEAWSPELAPVLEKAGFEWVMLDELAYNGHIGAVDYTKTYRVAGTKLKAVFREHRLSSIVSSIARDADRLKVAAREELKQDRYACTGMDGEVFGHHQIGHQRLLLGMMRDPEIEQVRMSEVFEQYPDVRDVKTVSCTWASSEDDIAKGIQFISWKDPKNEIHKLQWELLNLTVDRMSALPKQDPKYGQLRAKLDWALASDQFFWAAGKPWWMIEYIERGAYDLLSVLEDLPNVDHEVAGRGLALYHEILSLSYEWQRSGKIDSADKRARVPFKEQTLEGGDAAAWKAFYETMRREEQRAAERGAYEEAILWRDGLYKLEHKLDMYDTMYIIDLLHRKLPKGEIEDTIESYRKDYNQIRGGQVEQRSN
jgi:hypothetical protein